MSATEANRGGVRCMWMRGGTSKGGYFLKSDLPADTAARDAFLLSIMGSPDPRQIDGMGGADPLTSKIAVVSKSEREGIDVDYLFLQVFVDKAVVTDAQNCGNILAGVGPFAIERGLVTPSGDETRVAIYMENTGQVAVATVQTPGGIVTYTGDAAIDGVPGTSAPITINFLDTEGSVCSSLLPTGKVCDTIDGIATHHATEAFAGEPGRVGCLGVDHVVIRTDNLDRTCAAITESTGADVRRVRDAGGGVTQAFHKLGAVVVEVVAGGDQVQEPHLWGFVVNVADLDAVATWAGPDVVGAPKPATQPGRRIATARSGAGLGVPFALMDLGA